MAIPGPKAATNTRRYERAVQKAWRAYIRAITRKLESLPQNGTLGLTTGQLLLADLRKLAEIDYLDEQTLQRAASRVAWSGQMGTLRVLRSVGMPRSRESDFGFAPLLVKPNRLAQLTGFEADIATDMLGELFPSTMNQLSGWSREGLGYIKKAQLDTINELADDLPKVISGGGRWESLIERVNTRLGQGERHAAMVARDQVEKLNSVITEEMHKSAGVNSYRWRASNDERTRPVHQQADGQIILWSSMGYPNAGFYGEPAHAGRGGMCRCTAEPVPPDDW